MRDTRNFMKLESEEQDYYKPLNVGNFGTTILLNIKAIVQKKNYKLKSILIKLDHT